MSTNLDLIGDLAIIRGKSWGIPDNILVIEPFFDTDYSSWTPQAVIRDNYKSVNGTQLANFSFDTLVYDGEKLIIKPYLPLTETQNIFPTKYQGDSRQLKLPYCYLWDLELHSPDQTIVIPIIESSFVQVKYEVT